MDETHPSIASRRARSDLRLSFPSFIFTLPMCGTLRRAREKTESLYDEMLKKKKKNQIKNSHLAVNDMNTIESGRRCRKDPHRDLCALYLCLRLLLKRVERFLPILNVKPSSVDVFLCNFEYSRDCSLQSLATIAFAILALRPGCLSLFLFIALQFDNVTGALFWKFFFPFLLLMQLKVVATRQRYKDRDVSSAIVDHFLCYSPFSFFLYVCVLVLYLFALPRYCCPFFELVEAVLLCTSRTIHSSTAIALHFLLTHLHGLLFSPLVYFIHFNGLFFYFWQMEVS